MKITSYISRAACRTVRTTVYLFCLIVTLFIAANSYEIASGRDIPFLGSVQAVNLSPVTPTLGKQSTNNLLDKGREGDFGRPDALRMLIDKKPLRVVLAPGIKNDSKWLARANTSHVLYATESKAGNAGDMVIYMKKSWRTIPNPELISKGTNMFIDTSTGWRYMFRVQEIRHTGESQFVIPEARDTQLILTIDQDNGQFYVVRGQFVSLQKVDQ